MAASVPSTASLDSRIADVIAQITLPPTFDTFISHEGRKLVQHISQLLLPYCPHDYQVEGVCNLLDGNDVIGILATGAGKTGFFSMYILMLLVLGRSPPPGIARQEIPKDPALVVVCPTIGLEEDMVRFVT